LNAEFERRTEQQCIFPSRKIHLDSKIVSLIATERALHIGKRLLACGLITGAVGCTRARHSLPDGVNRLRRYFAKPFLSGSHSARCGLITPLGSAALDSVRARGGFCRKLVVDAALHSADVISAWTSVAHWYRRNESYCTPRHNS